MTTDEICDAILAIAKEHGRVNPNDVHRINPNQFSQKEAIDCLQIMENHDPPLVRKTLPDYYYYLTSFGEKFEGFVALAEKKESELIKERKAKTETRWLSRASITLTVINITWAISFGIFNYRNNQEINESMKKIKSQEKRLDSLIQLIKGEMAIVKKENYSLNKVMESMPGQPIWDTLQVNKDSIR
jgi:hypothetical protein